MNADDLGYRPFDADNHYYEALDAFTRHLDPALGPRIVQWCEIDGRRYHVIGGKVSRAVVNPTFDPIAKAGAMHDYFRGNPDGKNPVEFLRDREPIRPEYRDRDARLAVMDEQGIEAVWLFPTLGILYEELLKDDVEGVTLMFSAFNRWLQDDWGCSYRDKIFGAPSISLCDPDWAIRELEWALDHDARTIVLRPAAPTTAVGQRSPGDPMFDGFWARVNEAGITVVVHAGDSGYSSQGYADDAFSAAFGPGAGRPSIRMFAIERAAYDFLLSLVFDKLFDRFPNLRIASVENGSGFLPDLFRKLTSTSHKLMGYFSEDPAETFRRHVWINPFWEDDVYEIVDLMGANRVIFGSDWPHIEGMPQPLDYVNEVKELSDADRRLVLRENAVALNERHPA
ncbi:MAG TPA: amidohydrolase family protein [Acidimicrobiia bacterium]|nr:amidohydrolase family protein [Acidimicrobiia bacterium]